MKTQNSYNPSAAGLCLFAGCFIACTLLTPEARGQWSELGGNNALAANGSIFSICSDGAGNIYAGGWFTNGVDNGTGNNYVAKYNGNVWSELGLANWFIYSIFSDVTGNVYAAGAFTTFDTSSPGYQYKWDFQGNHYVVKWNGSTWDAVGGVYGLGANLPINSVCFDRTGNIYAAGDFTNGDCMGNSGCSGNQYVAQWKDNVWSELGGGTDSLAAHGQISSVCSDVAGNIYAAGEFRNGNRNYYVAKYNGSAWSELGGTNALSANGQIVSICRDKAGNIYAAGNFTNGINDTSGYEYVAKWNGTTWSELGGTNALAANFWISSLCCDAAGNIYAAGLFTNHSGKYYVAKYNGSAWSELGGTNALAANNYILSICSDSFGNIYAAGYFTNDSAKYYVAKYTNPPTGIEEVANPAASFRLYPNPTGKLVTVIGPENIETIKVFSTSGSVLQVIENLSGSQQNLNLSNLAKGTYYLQVNNESPLQKLVVQ